MNRHIGKITRRDALKVALLGAAGLVLPAGTRAAGLPAFPPAREEEGPTFVDPTAHIFNRAQVHLGHLVYVAPFASLIAGAPEGAESVEDDEGEAPEAHAIHIGNESDLQDGVTLNAGSGTIRIGEQVALAHGAIVKGPAEIGETGVCPGGLAVCPSFVGFNAEVDGATIEKDAMVLHLARVGPGVTIPSGRKVLPGKNVISDDEVATKTAPVTEADRAFMAGVIEVNVAFARGYAQLAAENPANVHGVNFDPGHTAFNPNRNLPSFAGVHQRHPDFRNRIIGDVRLADPFDRLHLVMRSQISLRADEGEPFEVGHISSMAAHTTFHALEHTHLHLGNRAHYGFHSLVHGGPAPFVTTTAGDDFTLGDWAVFFRSHAGSGVTVGCRSLVQESDLPAGTMIPSHQVWIGGKHVWDVEWGDCS